MLDRFEHFSLAITEISRYWHKLATEVLTKHGLKGAHATYLTTIYRYPDGITVPQLCEICGKDKSDASRILSTLEKNGLVRKQSVNGSTGPRRYGGLLFLTEDGKSVAEDVCHHASQAVEIAGRDLTSEEREIFYKSLESIAANLRELSETGILK